MYYERNEGANFGRAHWPRLLDLPPRDGPTTWTQVASRVHGRCTAASPPKRQILVSALLLGPTLFACTGAGLEDDGGADLAGQDDKGDAVPGIEVQSRLEPAPST